MEKIDWIFEDIDELKTPVGNFCVLDGDERIKFFVMKNRQNSPSNVRDEDDNIIGAIRTDTNYCIVIPTADLQLGKEYVIRFSDGNWKYCDSDEHTTCYNAVIDDWIVGIGAYDPNDERKFEQMLNYSKKNRLLDRGIIQTLESYDERNYEGYTVEALEMNNGYSFKLFDYTVDVVCFEVAWIRIDMFSAIEYEGALGLWLC